MSGFIASCRSYIKKTAEGIVIFVPDSYLKICEKTDEYVYETLQISVDMADDEKIKSFYCNHGLVAFLTDHGKLYVIDNSLHDFPPSANSDKKIFLTDEPDSNKNTKLILLSDNVKEMICIYNKIIYLTETNNLILFDNGYFYSQRDYTEPKYGGSEYDRRNIILNYQNYEHLRSVNNSIRECYYIDAFDDSYILSDHTNDIFLFKNDTMYLIVSLSIKGLLIKKIKIDTKEIEDGLRIADIFIDRMNHLLFIKKEIIYVLRSTGLKPLLANTLTNQDIFYFEDGEYCDIVYCDNNWETSQYELSNGSCDLAYCKSDKVIIRCELSGDWLIMSPGVENYDIVGQLRSLEIYLVKRTDITKYEKKSNNIFHHDREYYCDITNAKKYCVGRYVVIVQDEDNNIIIYSRQFEDLYEIYEKYFSIIETEDSHSQYTLKNPEMYKNIIFTRHLLVLELEDSHIRFNFDKDPKPVIINSTYDINTD